MLLNLLIFAKYPEPGKVKTRLARSVGLERAALLYKEMVETVISKTAPVNREYARTLYFDPPERQRDFEVWFSSPPRDRQSRIARLKWGGESRFSTPIPPHRGNIPTFCGDVTGRESTLAIRPQCAGDLGLRMKSAIEESFRSGADRVVLVGSDCTEIDRNLVLEAFRRLEASDVVIGPAADGGYYLIGINRRGGRTATPQLFTGVSWSTVSVLRETLQKAEAAGLRYDLLPTLSDIDEILPSLNSERALTGSDSFRQVKRSER